MICPVCHTNFTEDYCPVCYYHKVPDISQNEIIRRISRDITAFNQEKGEFGKTILASRIIYEYLMLDKANQEKVPEKNVRVLDGWLQKAIDAYFFKAYESSDTPEKIVDIRKARSQEDLLSGLARFGNLGEDEEYICLKVDVKEVRQEQVSFLNLPEKEKGAGGKKKPAPGKKEEKKEGGGRTREALEKKNEASSLEKKKEPAHAGKPGAKKKKEESKEPKPGSRKKNPAKGGFIDLGATVSGKRGGGGAASLFSGTGANPDVLRSQKKDRQDRGSPVQSRRPDRRGGQVNRFPEQPGGQSRAPVREKVLNDPTLDPMSPVNMPGIPDMEEIEYLGGLGGASSPAGFTPPVRELGFPDPAQRPEPDPAPEEPAAEAPPEPEPEPFIFRPIFEIECQPTQREHDVYNGALDEVYTSVLDSDGISEVRANGLSEGEIKETVIQSKPKRKFGFFGRKKKSMADINAEVLYEEKGPQEDEDGKDLSPRKRRKKDKKKKKKEEKQKRRGSFGLFRKKHLVMDLEDDDEPYDGYYDDIPVIPPEDGGMLRGFGGDIPWGIVLTAIALSGGMIAMFVIPFVN